MRVLLLTILCLIGVESYSQFSISANVSQDFSVDYKFNDKYRVELGFNDGRFEDSTIKATFKAELLKKEDFDGYIGAGFIGTDFDMATIPIGMDFYPFEKKAFSIILELDNQFGNSNVYVYGNVGIRYRFLK
ncbi:hypothetical protein [Carboxylicivirga sp. RSCT41]|uniref:hypothetical protein n=1 Tax=Carboxylicivirga agarovorans TaxID=3417570 RepID=UPI003D344E3C